MRAVALLLFLAAAPMAAQEHSAHAGHHPAPALQDSIMAPVKAMFDGMRAHDSAMVRSAFVPGAQFSRPPAPGEAHGYTTLEQFLGAVGRPGAPWDERIYDAEIREDGGMATVWTFFTFHLGERFSHCGVNAFQLVRTGEGWRISGLADSNRRAGCEVEGRTRTH
jgi:hypothetical protein